MFMRKIRIRKTEKAHIILQKEKLKTCKIMRKKRCKIKERFYGKLQSAI